MISTTTVVTSSSNPSTYGDSVTFTATVAGSSGTANISGTVTFFVGNVALGSSAVSGFGHTGTSTLSVSTLLVGTDTISASYSGDGNYSLSTSSGLSQVVNQGFVFPTLHVIFAAVYGQPLALKFQVAISGGAGILPPTGLVTFTKGATVLGIVPFVQDSSSETTATLVVSSLPVGSSSLTASYAGDGNYSATATMGMQTVSKANTSTSLISSVNPSALCQAVNFTATMAAVSPGAGLPTGTATFTINGAAGLPVSLVGGVATYSTSALPLGSNSISVAYNGDGNFNTSSSTALTQTVSAAVAWVVTAAPATWPDPLQSQEYRAGPDRVGLKDGAIVRDAAIIDAYVSTKCACSCGCKDDNTKTGQEPTRFSYTSRTLNVKPIVQATLASDFCAAVPSSIQARLTWNGTAQPTVTYSTTGHSAGDVYNLPLQVSSAVASSGFYNWSVRVLTTVGTFIYDSTVSGALPVVVNSSSPYGVGWSIAGTQDLIFGGVYQFWWGSGLGRLYSGTPGTLPFTYTSPPNDQGTMVKNADGTYTYTDKYKLKSNFNSGGQIVSQVDPHGLTTTYAYSSGLLSTITQPDGGVATFVYNVGNFLTSVQEPGGRYLTMSYDGSNNLTGIVDAAGGVYTFAYDGSHRLINDKIGPLNTTFAYSATNGTLVSIDRGLGTLTTITAAAVQGMGASPALNTSQAVATVKDPLGNVTSYTLDSLGRLTQLQTADGAKQTWNLDAAGYPTVYTDPLGRVTKNTYNASEDLTQVQYPDGTFATYQYDSTWHLATQIRDALNHYTTMTYDGATSDLLTRKDALGNVTTFTWSNGLKQTTTDALGRVTTLTWDSAKRRELSEKDALNNVTTFGYDTTGNRTSVQDALGRLTTFTYDGNRRMLTRTNALSGVVTNVYDAIGYVTSSMDELGRTTSFIYDQRGLRTSMMEAVGTAQQRTTTTNYDVATNPLYITDALGDITSYAYDALNRPIAKIDGYGTSSQRTTTTNYDAVSNTLSIIDPRGTTTSFGYDVMDRQIQQIEAYGNALQRTTTTSYDAVGNVYNITNPRGTVTSFGYDAVNQQTLRVDAVGVSGLQRTTTTAFDAVGNTLSVTNAIGAVTSFAYDALNRQTRTIEAQGSGVARTTTTNYDAVSNVQSVVNPRGYTTSFAYDALNRRVNEIDAYGDALQRTLTMTYDAVSNVLSATNGLNVTTSFSYDNLNRRVTTIDAYGAGLARTATTVYDLDDNVTAAIDPLGYRTTFGYDALNRRITVTNPDSGVATTVYDSVDNVVNSIDQLGHKTTYIYDLLNRRTQTVDARSGIVTLAYDPNNNLQSLTDPVNNQTQWLYDALDRKIQETDPLYNSATFAYDAIDRLTSTTDRLGQVVTNTYDLLNRVTNATGYAGTGLLTYTFDANNNLLTAATSTATNTMTYDSLDRLSSAKDAFATTLTMTYDAANNRTLMKDSFSGATTLTYDALNRATTMQYSGQSQTLREDFAYTTRDQVSNQTRYSNLAGTTTIGTSSMVYDTVGRMTNLQHLNGSSTNIANYTNTYDVASRITSEVLNGGAPTTYQYDTTDQLTNDAVKTYTYDLNGNRTMTGYTTGPANEITSDATWNYYCDKNGNIIQKTNISTGEVVVYGFDNRSRMNAATRTTSAGVQTQATYVYDALGQRIEKDVTISGITTITRFGYDGGQIWADLSGGNVLLMRYLLGQSVLERLARVSNTGTAAWLLPDRMGSIRNILDNTGAVIDTLVFDAYGNIVSESNPGSAGVYLWVSYRFDSEMGLYRPDQTTARYYDPKTGRWRNVDPIGFAAGDSNLLRYVRNNVMNAIDPSGLICFGVRIVVKSFIARIGDNTGRKLLFPPPGVFDDHIGRAYSRFLFHALVTATDEAYDENPKTAAKDKKYRLYSEKDISWCCDGDKLSCFKAEGLDTDVGKEGPFEGEGRSDGETMFVRNESSSSVTWRFTGWPNSTVEPAFGAIKNRRSKKIWHAIRVIASCKAGQGIYHITLSGSLFPSHRVFEDGKFLGLELVQGPFSDLWKSDPTYPSYVR